METGNLLPDLQQRWRDQQDELVRVITPLTAEQLDLRAAPHLHTIGEMVAHLVAARVRMLHGALREGGPELTPFAKWDDDYVVASDPVVLLHGLTSSWQMIEQALPRWTPADWQETFIESWPTGETATYSRSSILSYALKHEFHHSGEISLTLGIYNLASPEWK